MELMNYSPFIYAFGQRNIAVTGGGTLDGRGDGEHWWPWKGQARHGWKKGGPDQKKARQALEEMTARGGLLENLYFRDIEVGQVAHAVITIDFNYEEGRRGWSAGKCSRVSTSAIAYQPTARPQKWGERPVALSAQRCSFDSSQPW